jgi:hypothetical protein
MRWQNLKAILTAEWKQMDEIYLCTKPIIIAWAISLDEGMIALLQYSRFLQEKCNNHSDMNQ